MTTLRLASRAALIFSVLMVIVTAAVQLMMPFLPLKGDVLAFYSERLNEDTGVIKQGIYLMDLERWWVHPVTISEDYTSFEQLAWSPDGERIAYVAHIPGTSSPTDIYILDVDDGNVLNLTAHETENRKPSWSPDSQSIMFTLNWFSWIWDENSSHIHVVGVDGSELRPITHGRIAYDQAEWSPDGTRALVMLQVSPRYGFDVYVMNADGSDLRMLTNTPHEIENWPIWSPDGQHIAFVRSFGGGDTLYIMDVATRDEREITVAPSVSEPSWSPDGTRIAFSSYTYFGSGGRDIYVVDVNSGDLSRITHNPYNDRFAVWWP